MSAKQKECKEFWSKLNEKFSKSIDSINVNKDEALADYVLGDKSDNEGCQSITVKDVEWEKYTEKLNNLDKVEQVSQKNEELQTQLSGSQQNTVMASTLGPASGIGAGLSLFPLMAKLLKK